LGSVQAFPRKPGIATIADVWRVAPLGAGEMRVREMRHEDCAAIRALQREAAPAVPPATLQQLESRRHIFPEGQLVAEVDGAIVGAAGMIVVRWDDYALHHTWKSVTGDGYFTTHDPAGRTLYGSHVVADVNRRGFGVARALYQAQRRICRRILPHCDGAHTRQGQPQLALQRCIVLCKIAAYGGGRLWHSASNRTSLRLTIALSISSSHLMSVARCHSRQKFW